MKEREVCTWRGERGQSVRLRYLQHDGTEYVVMYCSLSRTAMDVDDESRMKDRNLCN